MKPSQAPGPYQGVIEPRPAPPARVEPRSALAEAEPSLSLLEVLLRHRGKVLGCVVAALALGVLYQLQAPRVYQSTAEIFVEKSRNGRPLSPLSPGGVSAGQPSTHASLLASTPVLQGALQDPAVAESQTLADVEGEAARLRVLRKNLSIQFSKDLETVAVSFRGPNQDETAPIANAIVRSYLRQLQVPLASAAGVAIEPGREAPAPGMLGDRMAEARLMELGQRLTEAQTELEIATIRLQEARAAGGNLAQIAAQLDDAGLDSKTYGLGEMAYLRAELARLEQSMEGMPSTWGPQHALRAPIQRQADALRVSLRTLRDEAQRSMLSLLAASRQNAAERVAELERLAAGAQSRAAQIAQLPVRVIEWAERPERKAAPRGVQSLGIALFLGLAFGIGWVLWVELKPAAARSGPWVEPVEPERADAAPPALLKSLDVERTLTPAGPPLLGLVPEIPAGRGLTSPNFDTTASSIHQIRAVLQVQAGSKNAKAFAFTSPRRGAGKTSVTIGVASSLAMSGTRTLVVDCDLAGRIARGQTGAPAHGKADASKPDPFGPIDPAGSSPDNASLDNIVIEQGYVSEDDQHVLNTPMPEIKVGITGMLEGGSLKQCAVEATVPGLSLLPAVHAQTHHIGKMSDAFIRRLIDEARGEYDLVLFDTGPVPGSVEALLATSQADGVVIVVPQGESSANLTRTMSYLKVVDAKVFGTVFNRASNAPEAGPSSKGSSSLAGAAATARATADRRKQRAADSAEADPVQEMQAEQDATHDDDEFLAGDAPLGSGILAAAVFSDADSGYKNDNWKLEETSEFNGSVEELFGDVEGAFAKDEEENNKSSPR
jgi:Mrp family chromosome partitioning ATPase